MVGTWIRDRSVFDAHVALSGLGNRGRPALVHALRLALAPRVSSEVVGNPAYLREIRSTLGEEFGRTLEDVLLAAEEDWTEWAREDRTEFADRLGNGPLFRAEDLWEISHLPDLPTESSRLALRRVNRLAIGIGPLSDSTYLAAIENLRQVSREDRTDDPYPAGGFAALSTKGTFENLVRSEVVYVGEGTSTEGGVDLFDVRFAENELLYYTRDEAPRTDARREICVVVDRPAELRTKAAELPEQHLVLIEGTLLAFQAFLLRIFGIAGSKMTVVFRTENGADAAVAEEEIALLKIALGAEVAHDRLAFVLEPADGEFDPGNSIVFSPRSEVAESTPVLGVYVNGCRWTVGGEPSTFTDTPRSFRRLADRMLMAVSRRGRTARKPSPRKKV